MKKLEVSFHSHELYYSGEGHDCGAPRFSPFYQEQRLLGLTNLIEFCHSLVFKGILIVFGFSRILLLLGFQEAR